MEYTETEAEAEYTEAFSIPLAKLITIVFYKYLHLLQLLPPHLPT